MNTQVRQEVHTTMRAHEFIGTGAGDCLVCHLPARNRWHVAQLGAPVTTWRPLTRPRPASARGRVLRNVAARPEGITVPDLARALDLPRPTVSAALADLMSGGWVRPATDRAGRQVTRAGVDGSPWPVWVLTLGGERTWRPVKTS